MGECGRCRGEECGEGDAEDGVDEDALAGETFSEGSEEGRGNGDAKGGGGDGHADTGFGGVEDAGEQGQDGLGAVELEEGADSAEGDGGGSFESRRGEVGLRGWWQESGYRGRESMDGRGEENVTSSSVTRGQAG